MAKNAYAQLNLENEIKLKKYFYLLRALLASVWVKVKNQPIPVYMMEMVELLTTDERDTIEQLIQIKVNAPEQYQHQLNPVLQQLILRLWQLSESLDFGEIKQGDIRLLNDFFKCTIKAI